MNRQLIFVLCILFNQSNIIAKIQNKIPFKRTYCASLTLHPPKIDGILDDQCWKNDGIWSGNFTQYTPKEGGAPTFPTKIKILYDYNNLYVSIFCYDTIPSKIRRILDRRDVFAGDIAGVAIDSYFDRRTAYEFSLTAAGQKIDLKHSGNGNYDLNWDGIWEGTTALSDSGWTAEMKIPFSQLRYNHCDTQIWGLHIWRWIDRYKEESQWQPITRNASAMVYLFGNLKCIDSIRSSRQIEFMPFLSGGIKHSAGDENPYLTKDHGFLNGGLDAKIGLSSNLTLDATVNPDFGQIEADPSELNLTAYETFFGERRPFFLEGSEIFDNTLGSDLLFYSRRIGAKPKYEPEMETGQYFENQENSTILGSVKLTGKTSHGLSIGIMNSLTDKEYGTIYSKNGSTRIMTEPMTNYFAGRLRKEVNEANTIYGMSFNSTTRDLSDSVLKSQIHKSAYTLSADYTHYWKNKFYYIYAKGVTSSLNGSSESIINLQESHLHRFQRPDAEYLHIDSSKTNLTGTGGSLEGGKIAGKYQFGASITYWSPCLDYNDLGFMRVADLIEQKTWAKYAINKPKGIFRSFDFNVDQTASSTFGGELSKNSTGLFMNAEFSNLWYGHLGIDKNFGYYDPRILRGGPALFDNGSWGAQIYLKTNDSKNFSANTSYSGYFGEDNSYRTSEYSVGLNYRPIRKISLSGTVFYSTNTQEYQYFTTIEATQNKYLIGRLEQHTLSFTIRTELFLSAKISLQYYGSPFTTIGKYSGFKEVNQSKSKDPSQRFTKLSSGEIVFDETSNTYQINETNGTSFNFDNPDFTFGQLRSNLVFRWEYMPGSVIYFVWSRDQTQQEQIYTSTFQPVYSNLFSKASHDIIMIKISYWFSI